MSTTINLKEVRASYGRCIAVPDFFDQFYDRFLSSNPVIKERFSQTDFKKQKELIKHGVNMMIGFYENNSIAVKVLDRIRESHSKEKMDINPRYYQDWKKSLLATIASNDKKLDDALRSAWEKVLSHGIDHISGGYLLQSA